MNLAFKSVQYFDDSLLFLEKQHLAVNMTHTQILWMTSIYFELFTTEYKQVAQIRMLYYTDVVILSIYVSVLS